jgi:hypothetical protein
MNRNPQFASDEMSETSDYIEFERALSSELLHKSNFECRISLFNNSYKNISNIKYYDNEIYRFSK